MEIVNEIKSDDKERQKFQHRNLAEVQRAKLEKLMKNPEKPVLIPELTKRDKEYNAPTFVRNVMGSSAGAGSGEFHVYRHLRRKEYARQKHLKMMSDTERMNEEYQQRLEDNQRKAEEKTNKKRAKRLKQKMKSRNKEKKQKLDEAASGSEKGEDSDDDEEINASDNNDSNQEIQSVREKTPEAVTSNEVTVKENKEHQEDNSTSNGNAE